MDWSRPPRDRHRGVGPEDAPDYIVDFMEEFKKVDIAKACGTEF